MVLCSQTSIKTGEHKMNALISWVLRQTLGTKRGTALLNLLGPWMPQITAALQPELDRKLDLATTKITGYVNSPNVVISSIASIVSAELSSIKL